MSSSSSPRRRALLEAALACFAEHGIEATTIALLRKATGASTGSLYHHFGSREGLLSALYLEGLRDFRQHKHAALACANTLAEGVRAIVRSHVDWISANPRWADFLFRQRQVIADTAAERQLALEQAEDATATARWAEHVGGLPPLPMPVLVSLVAGPVHEYARQWLGGQVSDPPKAWEPVFVSAALSALGLA